MNQSHNGIVGVLKKARAAIAEFDGQLDQLGRGVPATALLAELDETIASLSKPNPDEQGFFWWLLAVGFHEEAVADGVDFTDKRTRSLLARQFPLCHRGHFKAKVLGRPVDSAVAAAQGYRIVDAYLRQRGGQ